MLQILNKSNQHDMNLELDKLQSELLARGAWPNIFSVFKNLLISKNSMLKVLCDDFFIGLLRFKPFLCIYPFYSVFECFYHAVNQLNSCFVDMRITFLLNIFVAVV